MLSQGLLQQLQQGRQIHISAATARDSLKEGVPDELMPIWNLEAHVQT